MVLNSSLVSILSLKWEYHTSKEMLRNYITENGWSIYSLARKSGIPYSTLNDIVNGKVVIDNCKVAIIRSLAESLDMSMDDVYRLCLPEQHRCRNQYDIEVDLTVQGKTYHAQFEYMGEFIDIPLCKVNEDTTFYIDDILKWRSEEYIRGRRMEAWNTF